MKTNNPKLAYILLLFIFTISPALVQASVVTSESVLDSINTVREQKELPLLATNPLLEESAKAKAKALFDSQVFDHTYNDEPFYSDIEATGYHYATVGENLAIDYTSLEALINDWMNSPLHAKNILYKNFDETGIAVEAGVMNGVETVLVVEHFGQSSDTLAVDTAKETLTNVVTSPYVGIAGIIATTTTIELGTMLSLFMLRIKNRVRKNKKT